MKIAEKHVEKFFDWIRNIFAGGIVASIIFPFIVGIASWRYITFTTSHVVICSVITAFFAQFCFQLLETKDGDLSKLTGEWKMHAPIPVTIGGTAVLPFLIHYLVSENALDIFLGTIFFLCIFLILTAPWIPNKSKTKKPEDQ